MIRVYVAGPIGANDEGRELRVVAALEAGCQLLRAGFAPVVPHLWPAAIWNADNLRTYEEWMAVGFAYLEACGAVLRVPGESPGADREVARARELGIPVFFSVEEMLLADAWGTR